MKNILYIALFFALCFGSKAQAQNITDYQAKVNSLDQRQAEELKSLATGPVTVLYVTAENEAELHEGSTAKVVTMQVNQSADFTKFAQRFEDKLDEIILLNIDWDGQEMIVVPAEILNKMSSLKYIYIRSYETLNSAVIQNKFSNLMNQLNGNTTIEFLYYTMEQPS